MSQPSPAIRVSLLQRLLEDRLAGRLGRLEDYERMYPGHEELVAHEFLLATAAAADNSREGEDVAPLSEEPAVPPQLQAFVDAYREDSAAGRLVPLREYLLRFPDLDRVAAARFAAREETRHQWSQHSVLEPGGRVGAYRIQREIGRGGQGAVFLAIDERLNRQVALKVLTDAALVSEQAKARFRREAMVASRFDHPGICTVYEAGSVNGLAYVAMQYLQGQTLAQRLVADSASSLERTGRDMLRERVAWIEQAARAAHVAHREGVVHRDLKPSNLLLSEDGKVVLLDFGLARAQGSEEATLTRSGDVFGTPAYMAPEQVRGDVAAHGPGVDVYALGVTLFELLTGQRPFVAATREGLYRAILHESPPRLRRLAPVAPRDLEIVVATAIEKEPSARYQSALDFAEDLRAVLESRPIAASPPSLVSRVLRWARRDPVRAVLTAGIVAAVLIATAVGGYLFGQRDVLEAGEAALREQEIDRLLVEALGLAGSDAMLATTRLEQHLDDRSEFGLVRATLALAYLENGMPVQALEAADGRPASQSTEPAFALLRAEALRQLQRDDEARQAEEPVNGRTSAVAEFVQGWLLHSRFRAGDHSALDPAIDHLDRALQMSPRAELVFHHIRILAVQKRGDLREFEIAAQTMRDLWPAAPISWYWWGVSRQLCHGDSIGARDALTRCVEQSPDHADARTFLSLIELQLGNVAQAEEHYRRAVQVLERRDGRLAAQQHYIFGNSLLLLSRPESGLEPLRRALELDPDHVDASVALARCLVLTEQLEAALDLAWEIRDEHPERTDAFRVLCAALAALEEELYLEEQLREWLDSRADDGIGWLQLAVLLEQIGDPEECRDAAQRAWEHRESIEAESESERAALDQLKRRLDEEGGTAPGDR